MSRLRVGTSRVRVSGALVWEGSLLLRGRVCCSQSYVLSSAGWHVEEAELDIVHVMTYMRQRLNNSSVFLVEFFRCVGIPS